MEKNKKTHSKINTNCNAFYNKYYFTVMCTKAQQKQMLEKLKILLLLTVNKTDEQWKKELTAEYYVLREKGTERPLQANCYLTNKKGVYKCAACGNELLQTK